MSDRPSACPLKVAGDGSALLHPHSSAQSVAPIGTLANEEASACPTSAEAVSSSKATVPAELPRVISWLQHARRAGPIGGTLLVLAAHAVHLLALPLLAAWLGLNAASSPDAGSPLLAGHSGHAGHTGSSSLPMRWATDLLTAATVAAAISMCGAMARSWRSVRRHPLPCILYTAAALLCIGMVLL